MVWSSPLQCCSPAARWVGICFSLYISRIVCETTMPAEGVHRFGLRPDINPLPLWRSRRMLCAGHSSKLPVLSLGTATSSSTARPEPSAWHTSPKATSNGSTSKAVPSPGAPSCLPLAASSLPSTGTTFFSSSPALHLLCPWGHHPLLSLMLRDVTTLICFWPPWCRMSFMGGSRGTACPPWGFMVKLLQCTK